MKLESLLARGPVLVIQFIFTVTVWVDQTANVQSEMWDAAEETLGREKVSLCALGGPRVAPPRLSRHRCDPLPHPPTLSLSLSHNVLGNGGTWSRANRTCDTVFAEESVLQGWGKSVWIYIMPQSFKTQNIEIQILQQRRVKKFANFAKLQPGRTR